MKTLSRFFITFGVISLGLVIGFLCFTGLKAGSLYDYRDSFDGARLPEVDAIVVLAGARGRIAAGGDLWYRYFEMEEVDEGQHAPILYISGMGPSSSWSTFQNQVRVGVSKAFRPSDVVLETESTNTETNAQVFIRNARLRGWKRVILMTSSYHMKRSRLIFSRYIQKERAPIEFETLSLIQDPFSREEWYQSIHGIHVTILEYLKWVYYSAFWDP